ncbi:hypothetical protein NKI15_03290 [Mesorhizobium sp. M0862]|uniref:hypothetical protein n=1 Tax=Mesorhizobium sp. M0862 TaxID=2957015 RepID=UPI00333B8E24
MVPAVPAIEIASTSARFIEEPAERSMPAVMMTKESPIAAIPVMLDWSRRLAMLS